jgi:tetratricopeptide (TPR) repeat protein
LGRLSGDSGCGKWAQPLILAFALTIASPATAAKLGYSRAWCLSEALTPRETVSSCTAVLQKFRKSTDALVRRGLAYSELGEFEYAIGDFSRALRIDAEKAAAFYRRCPAIERSSPSYANLQDHKRGLELELSRRQTREALSRVRVALASLSRVEKRDGKALRGQRPEDAPPPARSQAPSPREDLSFLIVPGFLSLASLAVLIYLAGARENDARTETGKRSAS